MYLKMIGAVLIIASCSGVGFSIAAAHKSAEQAMTQLIEALDYMYCELQYRMTPLPELCETAGKQTPGAVGAVLKMLAGELEQQLSPDAASCMAAAVERVPRLPEAAKRNLMLMGKSLGRFDLTGQLSGLESVKQLCKRDLDGLLGNRDVRLRSYHTLGICAGIALVILFI